MLDSEQVHQFRQNGYTIVRGLFSQPEVDSYNQFFSDLNAKDIGGFQLDRLVQTTDDPLVRYRRIVNMHREYPSIKEWLLDDRLRECLIALLGKEPFAVQTMFYFKPPGARGQALHQDQYYLRVQPGTCVAAWMAVDRCDEENGCLWVVPGSQDLPVLCEIPSDTSQSFTEITVPLAAWMKPEPMIMNPGDVLFFNGQVIHGSQPNKTTDRFRRSLIAHYVEADAQKVAKFFQPVLRMDGSEVAMEASEQGGPCGVWVNKDGQAVVEMAGNDTLKELGNH